MQEHFDAGYDQLRQIAGSYMRNYSGSATLQATALQKELAH